MFSTNYIIDINENLRGKRFIKIHFCIINLLNFQLSVQIEDSEDIRHQLILDLNRNAVLWARFTHLNHGTFLKTFNGSAPVFLFPSQFIYNYYIASMATKQRIHLFNDYLWECCKFNVCVCR